MSRLGRKNGNQRNGRVRLRNPLARSARARKAGAHNDRRRVEQSGRHRMNHWEIEEWPS